MPVIFGKEVPTKTLWIGGGLMAAAVAVIVLLRARSAASAAAGQPQAQESDYGYSGGMSVPAPSQGAADSYQQQIGNAELEAQKIANDYQRNLVTQQQKQFDFEQGQAELLAPEYRAVEAAKLGAEAHYFKSLENVSVSCPKGSGKAIDPATGQPYCRQKSSGIPIVTDLVRTAEGIIYGAAAAAPSIGYQGAQAAATYYLGKTFPTQIQTSKTKTVTGGNVRVAPQPQPSYPVPEVYQI